MNKLTGNGKPSAYTHGEVGQFYEDTSTGDIYECRRSSKYSPTHGAPVGGYWWELRAKGEDIKEHEDIYPVLRELSEEIGNIPDVVVAYVEHSSYNMWRINTERGASGEDIKNAIQNDKLAILIANDITNPRPMVFFYHSIEDTEGYQFYLFKAADLETYINDAWHSGVPYMYIPVDAEDEMADVVLGTYDAVTKPIPVIQTATVGQTIAVKAVDENGKPTEWEAVDGGGDMANAVSTERVQIAAEFTVEGTFANISDHMSAGMALGKTYFVTLDGVEYECVAGPNSESPYYVDVGTGDPFIIYGHSGGGNMKFVEGGTHTVSIDAVEIPTNLLPAEKAKTSAVIQATPADGYSQDNRVFTLDKTYEEIMSDPNAMLMAEVWLSSNALGSGMFMLSGMSGYELTFTLDYMLNNGGFYHDCIIVKQDGTAVGKPFEYES